MKTAYHMATDIAGIEEQPVYYNKLMGVLIRE